MLHPRIDTACAVSATHPSGAAEPLVCADCPKDDAGSTKTCPWMASGSTGIDGKVQPVMCALDCRRLLATYR